MFNVNAKTGSNFKVAMRIYTETYSKEENVVLFKIDIDRIVTSLEEVETAVSSLEHDPTFKSFIESDSEFVIRELTMKEKLQKARAEYEDDKFFKKVCISFYAL